MAFEGLPEELMTLIFVKLPVKSLLACKCVRKSWYSLINSPQFINFHRSSSSPQFIFRRRVQEEEKEPGHVLSFYSYNTLNDLGNDINIPITHPTQGWVSLSGTCDGLVGITNHHDQILICNPAIREFRLLFVPPSLGNSSGYHIDSVAFGSDPKTGEYKVVMIGVPYDNSHLYDHDIPDEVCLNYSQYEDRYGDREAKVYAFSTDSWRETAVVIPAPFLYPRRAVSLNGAFHWCPWDNSNILTFHISNEVTDFIPMPEFGDIYRYRELCVSSKSQLSLILYDLGGRFEICVMTEYGVKESWTRLYEIGPLLDICFPCSFWDKQQLFLRTADAQLISCGLQRQNIRYFPIHGNFDVYVYSESLVSVNGIGE